MKKIIAKTKIKKEPDLENVGIHKDLMFKIKEHKKTTGTSVRFFVAQAIEEKLNKINRGS